MTEYIPISGGSISEMNKITDLFLNKRSLLILKDNDDKCFSYCYIREFLNPITKNRSRITKKDKELADKIINETNLTFENVSINEINKIEKKLEVNINIFSCNKNYENKNPVWKSRENYDKTLDLLLIEDINHYIIIKNLHCFLTDRCSEKDNFICRICLNIFYSEIKYNDHMSYCKTRKPQRLMPSNEKYIKFNKVQNCFWIILPYIFFIKNKILILYVLQIKITNINLFQEDIWLNVEIMNFQNKFKYLII